MIYFFFILSMDQYRIGCTTCEAILVEILPKIVTRTLQGTKPETFPIQHQKHASIAHLKLVLTLLAKTPQLPSILIKYCKTINRRQHKGIPIALKDDHVKQLISQIPEHPAICEGDHSTTRQALKCRICKFGQLPSRLPHCIHLYCYSCRENFGCETCTGTPYPIMSMTILIRLKENPILSEDGRPYLKDIS